MLVTVKEYCEKHGCDPGNVRRKLLKGEYTTARKSGATWLLDSEEPYVDKRVTSGKYKNWRKEKNDESEQ